MEETIKMKSAIATVALGSALMFGAAMAQGSSMSSQSGTMAGGMQHMTGGMHQTGASNGSMHTMPATVTSVDHKTGLIEVNSEGMALKLHYPPASLADVKDGDKITLHLGFTKP
jgi:uncharacterized protein (DUF2237 family)